MPFDEEVGRRGAAAPAQMEAAVPKVNAGVTIGFTVTANVAVVAH